MADSPVAHRQAGKWCKRCSRRHAGACQLAAIESDKPYLTIANRTPGEGEQWAGEPARRRRRAPRIWLPTDPPGLAPAPRAPDIFDHRPHRNRGMQGIANDLSSEEWDNRLIATAVELGCPRWAAEQVRTHPPARYALLKVWCDVQDAAEGDHDAKERVDYYRWCFQEARKQEVISDVPDRTVGLFER